jgi:heat shock protein HslJ
MRRPWLFALAAALLAAACDRVSGPSDAILDTTWRLRSVQRGNTVEAWSGDPNLFTLRLESDGRIGLFDNCNGCGGSYTLAGDRLRVGDLACTLKLCVDPGPGGPSDYVDLIAETSRLREEGEQLVLEADESVTLRFAR